MLFILLQGFDPELLAIIILSVVGVSSLLLSMVMFFLGLKITRADSKANFKWVLISFPIQLVIIFIIMLPMILMGMAGAFNDTDPPISAIIFTLVIAIFISINSINIFHRTGIAKALLVFFLMLIPLIIGGVIIGLMFAFSPIGYILD